MIAVTVSDWQAAIEVADFSPLSHHDAAFARELRDAVVSACDNDAVKAVVLRATGPDFAPRSPAEPPDLRTLWTQWHQAFGTSSSIYQTLCFAKKVVITEVTGDCLGAGSVLVLCSDLTVAADNACFGAPFAEVPESNFVLAALTMRLNRAKAWLIRDARLTAAEAQEAGLVNAVVPVGSTRDEARAMATAASRMPIDGVTMSKMLLQAVLDGHGVGRDFDQAGFYASAMWGGERVG